MSTRTGTTLFIADTTRSSGNTVVSMLSHGPQLADQNSRSITLFDCSAALVASLRSFCQRTSAAAIDADAAVVAIARVATTARRLARLFMVWPSELKPEAHLRLERRCSERA